MDLIQKRDDLKKWKERVFPLKTLQEKSLCLDQSSVVQKELFSHSSRFNIYQKCTELEKYVLKSIFVIGEGKIIFKDPLLDLDQIRPLLKTFVEIEAFYEGIGGIIGYQFLLIDSMVFSSKSAANTRHYLPPNYIDITKLTLDVREKIYLALQKLPEMGELYPLGGAADRLHLQHPITKKALPAAMMQFNQRSLLEILVEDVKAKEDLYQKLFAKKITIPIGIMTSHEKDNHNAILSLCKASNWFGKAKQDFFFFTQPSVPVVDEKGRWIVTKPYSVFLKPGGHGTIWKLAKQSGCLDWMKKQGKTKIMVRQINNPIAGLDYGLLAFYGYGVSKRYLFGFASCPRRVHSAEGVNVLVEKQEGLHYEYGISNIEYCEFKKYGIEDKPLNKGGLYSRFSSNTNLLFADLEAVENKVDSCPFPGALINFKPVLLPFSKQKIFAGRLESTMQNMADVFVEKIKQRQPSYTPQKTFVTYNHRNKTISTTKRVYSLNKDPIETPEKCFYDLLENHYDLLSNYCRFQLPKFVDLKTYLQKGPSFLFSYLPSLGPLYSIISQKIQGGVLHKRSEMVLNLSEILIQNITVKGSLCIQGEDLTSACILKNVKVQNKGVDYSKSHFWKGEIHRKESLQIILSKNSRLYIEDVSFLKGEKIFVREGQLVRINKKGITKTAYNSQAKGLWKYRFEKGYEIKLGLF